MNSRYRYVQGDNQQQRDFAECSAQALAAVMPLANTDPWYALSMKVKLRDDCMRAKGYAR